jgi:tetratricopeptide (TPR) repeat protein
VQAVDFAPDGSSLATGDWSTELRIWDAASGRLLWKTHSVAGLIWRVRFDPHNRFLLAAGTSGIEGWEIRPGSDQQLVEPFHWRPGREVRDIAFPPEGLGYATIGVGPARRGEIWRRELGLADEQLVADAYFGNAYCLHFCGDGRLLFPTSVDELGAWNWSARRRAADPEISFRGCFISPDGEWLVGNGSESSRPPLRLRRMASGEETLRLPDDGGVWSASWSPNGTRLAVGYADGALAIWNLEEVRARLAEFGIAIPSTARTTVPLSRPLSPPQDDEEFARAVVAERALLDEHAALANLDSLATRFTAAGWYPQAIAFAENAFRRRSRKLGPEHVETLNSVNTLAWLLATASESQGRNPPRAVELAEKLVRLAAENAAFRNTLGAARYSAGDWRGAIRDLQKSIDQLGPANPLNAFSGFIAAQAHWQLGEADRAREWFEKAVAWMENGGHDDPELKRFRAAAAALLDGAKAGSAG